MEAEFYVGVNVTHGLFMHESQAPLKAWHEAPWMLRLDDGLVQKDYSGPAVAD